MRLKQYLRHVYWLLLVVFNKILQEREELKKEMAGLEGGIEGNEESPIIKDFKGLENFALLDFKIVKDKREMF